MPWEGPPLDLPPIPVHTQQRAAPNRKLPHGCPTYLGEVSDNPTLLELQDHFRNPRFKRLYPTCSAPLSPNCTRLPPRSSSDRVLTFFRHSLCQVRAILFQKSGLDGDRFAANSDRYISTQYALCPTKAFSLTVAVGGAAEHLHPRHIEKTTVTSASRLTHESHLMLQQMFWGQLDRPSLLRPGSHNQPGESLWPSRQSFERHDA
jgi:hypothetical protein